MKIRKDPYEGIRPEMLPIEEFHKRFPIGLSGAEMSRYRVIGVYHTLLPNELQDALKNIFFYAQDIEDRAERRKYKRKQYEKIIKENQQYFRTGMSEQLEKVNKEIRRQELIEENRAKRLAEKKQLTVKSSKKESRPRLSLSTPRKKSKET